MDDNQGHPLSISGLSLLPEKLVQSEALGESELEQLVEESLSPVAQALENTFKRHDFLSIKALKSVCEGQYKEAMEVFSTRTGSGVQSNSIPPDQVFKYKSILSNNLRRLFLQFRIENSEKKTKFLEAIIQQLASKYKDTVEREINQKTCLVEELKGILALAKEKMKAEFGQKCGNREPEFFSEALPKLNSVLENLDNQFQDTNNSKLTKKEIECEDIFDKLTDYYEEMLDIAVPETNFKTITEETLMKTHEKCEQRILKKFKNSIQFDNPKLQDAALAELRTKVNKIFTRVTTEVAKTQTEVSKSATALVARITRSYVESMESAIDAETSEKDVNKEHQMQSNIAKNEMSGLYQICGMDEVNRQKEILNKNIADAFIQIKNKIQGHKSDLNERWTNGISNAIAKYDEVMATLAGGPRLLTEDELVEHNRQVQSDIIDACEKLNWLPSEHKQLFESELKEKMEESLNEIVSENGKKIEKLQEEINQQVPEWIESYKNEIQQFVTRNQEFIPLDQLRFEHQQAYQRVEQAFFQKGQVLPQPVLQKFSSTLSSRIEDSFSSYQNSIQSRFDKKKTELLNCVPECLEIYSNEMESCQRNCLDEVQFQRIHNSNRLRAVAYMDRLSTKVFKGVPPAWVEEAKEKLQTEIQTEFQTHKDKLLREIRKKEEKLRDLKEKAKGFYNNGFQSKMSKVRNENDIKEVHTQAICKTLEIFEEEFPKNYTMEKFFNEKQALEKELEQEYQMVLKDFREKSDLFDAMTKRAVRDIAEGFKSRMEKAIRHGNYSYFTNDQLEGMHITALNDGLNKIQNYTQGGPVTVDPKVYEDQLVQELQKNLEFVLNENVLKRQHVEVEVKESIKQTKSDLLGKLMKMNDPEPQLSKFIEECTNKFNLLIRKNYTFPDAEFMNNFVTPELEKALHEAHAEWMLAREPEPDKFELELIRATRIYNKEMEGRINPTHCYSFKCLEDFHRRAVLEAKKFFAAEIPQTRNVQKKFGTTLTEAFRKYKDKNNLQAAELVDAVIGIDLGTTNSCVSVYRNGMAEMIPDRNTHKKVVPSYVLFETKDNIVVGESAKDQSVIYPNLTIFDAKRLIGRKFADPITQKDIGLWPFEVINDKNRPKIKVHGETYFPEEISAKILKKLKEDAETHLGCTIKSAVITVPAHFNDAQKQATKTAGDLAGLKVLQLINEPTSAAIAYSLNYTDIKPKTILVYDLGGGTFDISIMEVKGGELTVKAVGGDTHLGGEDFDNNLVNFCIEKFRQAHGLSINDDKLPKNEKYRKLRRIRHKCEQAKINLSVPNAKSAKVIVDRIFESVDMEISVTVEDFNMMNESLFQKTILTVQQALVDANLDKSNIDDVVLVGGSTRIPRIQQLLKEFFDGKVLNMNLNPDEVVAQGAAIYAAILNGSKAASLGHIKFSDVTPLSLGISILGGRFSVIIPKNTPVPVEKTETYVTVYRNQTEVGINIYEGEEKVAKQNNLLGNFLLKGIPPRLPGREPIDITISCDQEGLLHVKAVCRSTGGNEEIEIQSERHGLTKDEIKLLKEKVDESNMDLD